MLKQDKQEDDKYLDNQDLTPVSNGSLISVQNHRNENE